MELFHISLQRIEHLFLVIFRRADPPVTRDILRLAQIIDLHPMGYDRRAQLIQVLDGRMTTDWLEGVYREKSDASFLIFKTQDPAWRLGGRLSEACHHLSPEFRTSIGDERIR